MITREQAEAVVIRERSGANEFFAREVRIISLKPTKLSESPPANDCVELGDIEPEDNAWSCNFEYRDKNPGSGKGWGPWYSGHCYVVEAKPGPYVVS